MNWVPLLGNFHIDAALITFKGELVNDDSGQQYVAVGNLLNDHTLGDGTISAEIEFLDSVEEQGCELILYYDPRTQFYLTAGFSITQSLVHVRSFSNLNVQGHAIYAANGQRNHLQPNTTYKLDAKVKGSQVSIFVDTVEILVANLPGPIARGQTGLWCYGTKGIRISNFSISKTKPQAFVVMEFSEKFNALHQEVIKPICHQVGLKAIRADDTFGPGLIIADIVQKIIQAKVIIAEVSSANPNVYYELGYAHAMQKPTILLAEENTELPFDVSPFRTIFYRDSIPGKSHIEENLKNHLEAVL